MSCLGAFIGLRCTTRAYAYTGAARARWLVLAAISIGTTGVWVMHFIAMLGYTIPGMTIRYNIAITVASMLIAVAVVLAGLLIVGFGQPTVRNLLVAGVITGVGVASMHYTGMAAMEMRATMSYKPALFAISVVIGIVAATAALWAALRLRGVRTTLGASLIMGVAVSGMHYTGMAAMQMHDVPAGTPVPAGGATAQGFVLPLVLGIAVISILMTALLVFSPTEAEIIEDRLLMERIDAATARLAAVQQPTQAGPAAGWPGVTYTGTGSPGQAAPAGTSGPAGQNGQRGPGGQADQYGQYGQAGQHGQYDSAVQNGQGRRNGQAGENGQNGHRGQNSQAERNGDGGRGSRERPRRRTGRPESPPDPDRRLA